MSKSEPKAEKKSAKRKHTEVEDQPADDAAIVSKKAKKEKIGSEGKKKSSKKDKDGKHDKRKSQKEQKAERADALNHDEFDVEDKAIEAVEDSGEVVKPKEGSRKSKKSKKEKKEKKENAKADTEAETAAVDGKAEKKKKKSEKAESGDKPTEVNGDPDKKRSKKDKQVKKAKKATEAANGDQDQNTEGAEAVDKADEKSGKKNRFICFIGMSTLILSLHKTHANLIDSNSAGNLPFTATEADIKAHFSSLHPTSIRLLTERDNPTKSRGIAFVEFDNYSHMKTCLAKFHHTEFTDARGSTRRINVELTAGGGGKAESRMVKVAEKNQRLNEQRARRIEKEEQEKLEKATTKQEVGEKKAALEDTREEQFVHPSRRAHVPGRRS